MYLYYKKLPYIYISLSGSTCTAVLTVIIEYSITCKNMLKTWEVWLRIDLLKCTSTAEIFLVCIAIATSKTNYTTTIKIRINILV